MIARRVLTRPVLPERYRPFPSGPRWASAASIRSRTAESGRRPSHVISPAIPHTIVCLLISSSRVSGCTILNENSFRVSPEQENVPGAGLKPCYQTLRIAHHTKEMITVTRTPPMTRRKMSGHHGHQSDALAFTKLSSAAPLKRRALENRREAVRAGMRTACNQGADASYILRLISLAVNLLRYWSSTASEIIQTPMLNLLINE